MENILIALSGHAGAGKNTTADFLTINGQVSFAEPLKKFVQEVFDFDDLQIYGPSQFRNALDTRYRRSNGELLTPRHALQTLGTEWGRECYPNIWADYGIRRARALWAQGISLVVFTDCRFVNEARAVREAGGHVWRIERPGAGLYGESAAHASEQEQDSPEFDALVSKVILNTGTLDDLQETVRCAAADLFPGL